MKYHIISYYIADSSTKVMTPTTSEVISTENGQINSDIKSRGSAKYLLISDSSVVSTFNTTQERNGK